MVANSTRLGPGTLTLGPTATPLDFSCQLQNAVVAYDKDADDNITVLCGDVVAGSVTYTATLSGTFLQDLADSAGIVAYSWDNKGDTVEFTYTPNTAAGATVTGSVTIDPLDIGSTEDYGAVMTSDFEWDCVGEPTFTPGTGAAAAESRAEPDLVPA